MFCPNCGNEISDEARFCAKCGAKIPDTEPVPNYAQVPQEDNPSQEFAAEPGSANDMPHADLGPANIRPVHGKNRLPLIIGLAAVFLAVAVFGGAMLIWQSSPGESIKKQLVLGEKYLLEENYEQAILAFEKAIEIDPKNPEPYLKLAEIYTRQDDYEKAVKILEKARKAGAEEADEDGKIEKRLEEGKIILKEMKESEAAENESSQNTAITTKDESSQNITETTEATQAAQTEPLKPEYAAGEWLQENGRWRFRTTDGNYLNDGWYWLDANMDLVAEAYAFDKNGYLETDKYVDASISNDFGEIYVDADGVARTFYSSYSGTSPVWTIDMPDCAYTIKRATDEPWVYRGDFEYKFETQNGYNDLRMFDVNYGALDEYGYPESLGCISPFMRYYMDFEYEGYTAKREEIPLLDKGSYYEIPVEVIFDYSEDSLNFFITATVRFTKDCIIYYGYYDGQSYYEDTLEHFLSQDDPEWLGNFMTIEQVDNRGYATRIRTFSAD
ncbi:TPR repeat-containing protein [Oribacterium sp. KHPX15]|uniref:tetratricopeptide repeat protein n=1 Tax=Oribacterium sp. KHPX15 TaxID=1855342 RepID=UPI000894500E|nr:tetratricopeptide repeat protein [Oribacterium sp. KHPX15]SEA67836.1 TPR repeat-containing protein [Oribacterium sp. KHPX15]